MVILIEHYVPVGLVGNTPALLCPKCRGDYVHPVSIGCLPPGAARGHLRIDADGIHWDRSQAAVGRGVIVTLRFACEHGHLFDFRLHFHKGQTFIDQQVTSVPQDQFPRTLWRT